MAILPTSTHKNYHSSDGGICFCCRRRDDGIGALTYDLWSDNKNIVKMIYACNEHITLLRLARTMKQKDWDFSEQKAIENGASDRAGAYLDKIGKTDLATLEPHEWFQFLKEAVTGFGDDLSKRIGSHDDIPF